MTRGTDCMANHLQKLQVGSAAHLAYTNEAARLYRIPDGDADKMTRAKALIKTLYDKYGRDPAVEYLVDKYLFFVY